MRRPSCTQSLRCRLGRCASGQHIIKQQHAFVLQLRGMACRHGKSTSNIAAALGQWQQALRRSVASALEPAAVDYCLLALQSGVVMHLLAQGFSQQQALVVATLG